MIVVDRTSVGWRELGSGFWALLLLLLLATSLFWVATKAAVDEVGGACKQTETGWLDGKTAHGKARDPHSMVRVVVVVVA